MGTPKKPAPVKLIIGFIFRQNNAFRRAADYLKKRFGETNFESEILPFSYTAYYEKEFGRKLKRKFIAFNKLIPPERLSEIKNFTNCLEKKLSSGRKRKVNIDPGYLDLAKLVLATTKDYRHRVYLGKGIFAEVALSYRDKSFRPCEWTYPDYQSAEYIGIFNRIREIYAQQVKDK